MLVGGGGADAKCKLMISEVMSLVCSDWPLQNAQTNHLFRVFRVPASRAIHWIFQIVNCIDKHVTKDDGRKRLVKEQNSKKGFEKNEHACRVEGFSKSDSTGSQYLKLAGPTWTEPNLV